MNRTIQKLRVNYALKLNFSSNSFKLYNLCKIEPC